MPHHFFFHLWSSLVCISSLQKLHEANPNFSNKLIKSHLITGFHNNKVCQYCRGLRLCPTTNTTCTPIHRYPIFSTRYSVLCKVYTGYHGTNEIEHGLCAYTVDNPLFKAQGLSLHTGAQTMFYLSYDYFLC